MHRASTENSSKDETDSGIRETPLKVYTYLVFHRELALALRHATQMIRVAKHVIECDVHHCCELVLAYFAVDNCPTAGVQSSDHTA